ncbi:MAG TPA: energy transducer TonB [Accumulibacter sp.]|nr:energy transducer TonB [Accumulibacter sp.]
MASVFSGERRLLIALACSLVGHAVVLVTVPFIQPFDFSVKRKIIRVDLAGVRQVDISGNSSCPIVVQPQDTSRGKTIGELLIRRSPAERFVPKVMGRMRAATPEAPSIVELRPGPALHAATASDERHEIADPEDLRHYRFALAVAARRFKRYSALAREHGWQGRVDIVVSAGFATPLPMLSLVKSSGQPALDEEALTMLERASAATEMPGNLKGKDFRFVLSMEFSLAND